MSKTARGANLPGLEIDDDDALTLYQQIYGRLRRLILSGGLRPGARLPSTRMLAGDLGVSRTTTEQAYGRLLAEGYLDRRTGDGTYVAQLRRPTAAEGNQRKPHRSTLSRRGEGIGTASACREPDLVRAFSAGLPSVADFPLALWHRLLARRSRLSGRDLLGYGDPAGYPSLREAVAAYLNAARGVVCRPEQVVILTSSQQALDLAARLLLDPDDSAWLEEPGYLGARTALRGAGAKIVPVPVDANGLDVAAGCARAPGARLAYVTPTHQYPTGVTMSLERRLALLSWASRASSWIVEDDYDSEFRYGSHPIAAIQGLDRGSRVIYVGTFSKVLFPSIRIAYAVLPDDLVSAFVNARTQLDGHTSQLPQAVLADFITEGHFGAHLRRMRAIYRGRRDVLLESVDRELRGLLKIGSSEAGLQVAAYLPGEQNDEKISRRAASVGIELPPLSRYALGRNPETGFLLGYSGLVPLAIREGVRRLATVLEKGA
jgi:GntR family transcriptional regulator/MocR family aminotransferase